MRSREELIASVLEWEDRPEHVRAHEVPFEGDEGCGSRFFTVYHPDYVAALRRCVDRLEAEVSA